MMTIDRYGAPAALRRPVDRALTTYYVPMRAVAWFGGAAFVGSLGYLAYFYAITLAVPGDRSEPSFWNALVDLALFSAFATHHSLFARTRVKRWLLHVVPAGAERPLYVGVASALAVTLCMLWKPVPGVMYEATGSWRLVFWALQALGVVTIVRAASVLDPLELAGVLSPRRAECARRGAIRQASGSTRSGELKIVGPFRFVRHPIYLGWMLLVFGAPLMTVNRLLFAIISSTYLILAIPWEEKSLAAAHGDRYRDYQRTVRWRVIPGLW